jgi:uncharacterized protein YjaG (DUF416 family)
MEGKVECELFKIKVFASLGDMVHGMGDEISEIYCRLHGISVNYEKRLEKLNVFKPDGERYQKYTSKPIFVDENLLKSLVEILAKQSEVDKLKNGVAGEIKSILIPSQLPRK